MFHLSVEWREEELKGGRREGWEKGEEGGRGRRREGGGRGGGREGEEGGMRQS